MPEREPVLTEREKTHGKFLEVSHLAQFLKAELRAQPGFMNLDGELCECLDAITVKIARILAGDPYYKDHWEDIAGYAKLGVEVCERETKRR